jgi:prolyl oligopeptidase
LQKLDIPEKSGVAFFSTQMIVTPRETWKIGEKTYASGSVLAIDFKPFKW